MDLIEEYIKIIKEYTDVPEVFLRASGYHLISAMLGQYFEIPWLHKGRPNLWFLNSSIPGRMRRSTVSSFDDCVLYSSLTQFYMKTMKELDKKFLESH